jgi:hypothetical protein
LLACRLNLNKAADLLLKVGRASRNQADQTVYYDAERWKEEGQLEKIKDYLKCTDKEMILAQINGNIKIYRELCELSETLESKSFRNPEILPILTKVLNEQDGEEFGGHSFLKSKSKLSEFNNNSSYNINTNNINTSGISNMPSLIKPIKSTNLPSYAENYPSQAKSNRFSRVKSATSSFFSSSGSPSSPSSSSVYWNSSGRRFNATNSTSIHNNNVNNSLDQSQPLMSNSEDLLNLNSIVKQTMNKVTVKKKKSNDTHQQQGVNTLLEMSSGQQTVDSFFGSKSEHEVSGHETSSGVGSSFMTGSADSMNSSQLSQQQTSPFNQTISQIFYTAALQQTKNYRSSVKYVEPVIVEKVKTIQNSKKSTRSTLAIIREESRLGKLQSKKLVPLKTNMTTTTKPINITMKSTNMKSLIKQN